MNFEIKKIIGFFVGALAIFAPIFFILADSSATSVDVFSVPAPGTITATVISYSEIDLEWDDVLNAVSYKIYRDSVYIGTTASSSYSDTGLSASTAYSYQVSSVDSGSIESSLSSAVTATTLAVPVAGGASIGGQRIYYSQPQNIKPVIINKDEKYSDAKQVMLYFYAQNAEQMMISNNSDFSGAKWEEYKTIKMWTLIGSGDQKVYAKFKNSQGAISNVFMDMISISDKGLDQEKLNQAMINLEKLRQDIINFAKPSYQTKEQEFIGQSLQEKEKNTQEFQKQINEQEQELNLIQEKPEDILIKELQKEKEKEFDFKDYLWIVPVLIFLIFFVFKIKK